MGIEFRYDFQAKIDQLRDYFSKRTLSEEKSNELAELIEEIINYINYYQEEHIILQKNKILEDLQKAFNANCKIKYNDDI